MRRKLFRHTAILPSLRSAGLSEILGEASERTESGSVGEAERVPKFIHPPVAQHVHPGPNAIGNSSLYFSTVRICPHHFSSGADHDTIANLSCGANSDPWLKLVSLRQQKVKPSSLSREECLPEVPPKTRYGTKPTSTSIWLHGAASDPSLTGHSLVACMVAPS